MIIDPLKQVNKLVNVNKLNNRMDKIVNEITEFLIEEYSNVIGTMGFGERNRDAVENIIREKIDKTYSALGMLGSYTIVDILPNVIENCKEKHLEQRINFVEANAKTNTKEKYDIIICYMLLHELPPITREKVLENIMNSLKSGGKAIFIDYNLPNHYNPLKYFIRAYNRLYQPFAEALWKNNIKDITPNAETCSWSKQTYFGGIYQKVVATKLK